MKLPSAHSLSKGFLAALPAEERERLGLAGIDPALAAKRWKAGQEKDLQKLIWSWLNLHEMVILGGRMDKRTRRVVGEPDFVTVLPPDGHFLSIECKAHGETLRPEQAALASKIMRDGGTVCVCYSLDDLRGCIQELSPRTKTTQPKKEPI